MTPMLLRLPSGIWLNMADVILIEPANQTQLRLTWPGCRHTLMGDDAKAVLAWAEGRSYAVEGATT